MFLSCSKWFSRKLLGGWLVLALFIVGLNSGCGPATSDSATTTPDGNVQSNGSGFQTFGRGITNATNVDLSSPFGCPVNPETLEMMAPVPWPLERLADRWGGTAKKYSEVPTSPAVPAERCGARDSYEFLTILTCDNGTRPFSQPADAQSARVGNMGPGGSCGFVVDLYQVACPEKTYEMYVDMYHCPQGQSVF